MKKFNYLLYFITLIYSFLLNAQNQNNTWVYGNVNFQFLNNIEVIGFNNGHGSDPY